MTTAEDVRRAGIDRVARAASWLFVPGSRPDRFAKAAASGAAELILDLEDAVAPAAKPAARSAVADWLAGEGAGWVRINDLTTPWAEDDLVALGGPVPPAGLQGVVVPKADGATLPRLADLLAPGVPVIALVESARGLRDVDLLCRHPVVVGLAFGAIDYALDIDAVDPAAPLAARLALVVACRAAGLSAPIDGVSVELHDAEAVTRDAAAARALGFGGKLCIHPSQIVPVDAAFTPSVEELDAARRLLAYAAGLPPADAGAFQFDGRMVDRPVLARAERIVARGATRSEGR